jgi:hypothetical protein
MYYIGGKRPIGEVIMRRTLFSLVLLGILAGACWGDHITVSGNVSGVWDVDTVLVAGGINVPANLRLTIQPGVLVLFQGHYSLIINSGAELSANGSSTDSIIFISSQPSIGWGGLRFHNSSPNCRLSYCMLKYGRALWSQNFKGGGIYCSQCTLVVSNCTISSCETGDENYNTSNKGGGICASRANLYLGESLIDSCAAYSGISGYAAYGGALYCDSSEIEVSNCSILNNRVDASGYLMPAYAGGFYIDYYSSARIIQNHFENNWAETILISGDAGTFQYISQNIIIGTDDYCIRPGAGSYLIVNNYITNGYYGIQFSDGSTNNSRLVAGNIIYNCRTGIRNYCENINILNNIFRGNPWISTGIISHTGSFANGQIYINGNISLLSGS